VPVLGVGDKFPALPVDLPGGTTLQLPDALAGHYGVVLFYRGSVRWTSSFDALSTQIHPLSGEGTIS
jgi:hypothetical protein